MPSNLGASLSGSFKIGGKIKVNRLGLRRHAGHGPGHLGSAARTRRKRCAAFKRLPELGMDFIDTADAYGPDVSENLIREALYPYNGLLIATKGGLTRPGPERWSPNGNPEYLMRRRIKAASG